MIIFYMTKCHLRDVVHQRHRVDCHVLDKFKYFLSTEMYITLLSLTAVINTDV